MMDQRAHTLEEIRDCWLRNRGQDGSDWEQALSSVYDLGLILLKKYMNHVYRCEGVTFIEDRYLREPNDFKDEELRVLQNIDSELLE